MLFPKIDAQKTKDNVDNFLKNYHRLKRLAGMPFEQKVTATFTLEPKSFTGGKETSAIERGIERKIDAETLLLQINYAINCLGAESRRRLYDKYIGHNHSYDYEIYAAEMISEATYYREIGKAQIEFAEAFNGGSLLTYENE